MWRKSEILYLVVLLSFAVYVTGQSGVRRCFNFHWLGPNFNNESIFMNATCSRAIGLAKDVPCVHPLVASWYKPCVAGDFTNIQATVQSILRSKTTIWGSHRDDGSWPDVDYIWRNHHNASCILANNDVCAQYTYYFNGQPENSTYFCTRAVDQLGNAITSGCHQQINGSYAKKVCFCRSDPGAFPCNDSIIPSMNYVTIALMTIVVILQNVVNNKYINYN